MDTHLLFHIVMVTAVSIGSAALIHRTAILHSVIHQGIPPGSDRSRRVRMTAFDRRVWMLLMVLFGLAAGALTRIIDASGVVSLLSAGFTLMLCTRIVYRSRTRFVAATGVALFLVSKIGMLILIGIRI